MNLTSAPCQDIQPYLHVVLTDVLLLVAAIALMVAAFYLGRRDRRRNEYRVDDPPEMMAIAGSRLLPLRGQNTDRSTAFAAAIHKLCRM